MIEYLKYYFNKFVSFYKKWKLNVWIFVIGYLLLFTGIVGVFTTYFQLIIKKLFLLSLWYITIYIIRIERLGHLEWDDFWKRIYYFVLLIGSALIIALG